MDDETSLNGEFYSYRIINKTTPTEYVGSTGIGDKRIKIHISTLRRGIHSNKPLQEDYNRLGKEFHDNFDVEIIPAKTREEAYAVEQKLLDEKFSSGNLYNVSPLAKGALNFGDCNVGRKHSEETKAKMKQSAIGRTLSEETKEKISKAGVGRPGTMLGKNLSDASKEKIRQANLGKTHTDETKAKMCAAHVESRKAVSIDGVKYESLSAAAQKLGITRTRVYTRVNSDTERFSDWRYINE